MEQQVSRAQAVQQVHKELKVQLERQDQWDPVVHLAHLVVKGHLVTKDSQVLLVTLVPQVLLVQQAPVELRVQKVPKELQECKVLLEQLDHKVP